MITNRHAGLHELLIVDVLEQFSSNADADRPSRIHLDDAARRQFPRDLADYEPFRCVAVSVYSWPAHGFTSVAVAIPPQNP